MAGIAVLGPLTIEGDGGLLAPRERVVLAALTVRRGEAVSAETLADALWEARVPASWAKVVQGCVVRLRKVLGAAAIETRTQGYRLVVPEDEVDAYRFERLVTRGHELLTLGQPDRAAYILDEALALWRGRALPDLGGWEPGRIEAARLEELRQDAEELRLDAVLQAGRFREVLADARARVAEAPLREHRWAVLAVAQYQAGRQADALRTLREARTMLRRELGLDPGEEIVALEEAILRQDPALVAPRLLDASTACPYPGLMTYDVGDADGFFGRDEDVAACLRRLKDDGVLVVVGPSGSGKSSLVRAGVAAALERAGDRVAVVTPGARPMDALTAVSASHPPVLVVDQCEEAVTLCRDHEQQARFFATLAALAEQATLLVALRADRLGELSAHPLFARLVERGLFLLGRMDAEDLRASIEGPARQAGLLLEAGLVDLLIRDVEGEPGALPLLSHALRTTWERREGRTLTVAGYQASGGIRRAVAQSAEQVYEQTAEAQRPILRDLLLRLVSPSPEGEPVRARVPRRLVAADADREQVVEQLVRARLVTSGEDGVELAHEALVKAWPRLQGWLDDDVEGQRIWRHLANAAAAWEAMGRPDSELYRGVRLARAAEWRERTAPDLNPVEHTFLDTSRQHADTERRTARRRRRRLTAILAAGLAVTTALSAIATVNQQRAARAAELARTRELTAAAVAVLDTEPALAKLLALVAADLTEPTVDTLAVLHRTFAQDPVIGRYRWPGEHEVRSLTTALHPDGTRLVAAGMYSGPSTHLEVYDFESDEVVWTWDTGDPALVIDRPFFSTDGASVVAGVLWEPEDGREASPAVDRLGALIWDGDTGELVHRVDLGRCGGFVAAMSGSSVLAQTLPDDEAPGCWASDGGSLSVELIDADTGERQVLATRTWGREFAMSGDGRFAAVTADTPDGAATMVVDLATGERIFELDPFQHEGALDGVVRALNHDGSLLAVGYQPIAVWDVVEGEHVATFRGHAGDAAPVFAAEGDVVYSAGVDGALRRWDARSGEEVAVHRAVGTGMWPSIGATGRALVADPSTRQATLIDTRARPELWGVDTCEGFVNAQTLGVAGGYAALSVLCAGDEAMTYVVDLATRELAYAVPGHRSQDLSLSPDGTRFARQEGTPPDAGPDDGEWHGPPRVRDLATGEVVAAFDDVCTWHGADPLGREPWEQPGCHEYPDVPFWLTNWAFTWSPDSALVVAASQFGAVVWDAGSGAAVGHPGDACGSPAQWPLFSPDGDELFMFCPWRGRVVAVSTETWTELRGADLDPSLEARDSIALAGHTPDEQWLVGIGGAFFHGGGGLLHWIDPMSLEIRHTLPRIHEGTTKAWAMSPDRTVLATGSSDGFVKVWDVTGRHLVHEIHVGDTQVQGLAFVDDHHLAVAPEEGGIRVYTLDAAELLEIVRASLARGFTATECARFNFGEDCPTLAGLRGVEEGVENLDNARRVHTRPAVQN